MKIYAEELLTTQELADRLKITVETIRRWKLQGLPAITLSENAVRFQLSEVIDWRTKVMAEKTEKRLNKKKAIEQKVR